MAVQNLIGQRFHSLEVISGPIIKNKKTYWVCKCECGKEKIARADQLKNGQTKSCGCYKNKIFIENNKKRQTLDLTNQQFGKITALYPTEERSADGRVIWQCQCECGTLLKVNTHDLQEHRVMSCGCLKSKGELQIQQLLSSCNIPFATQQTFSTCRFPNSGYLAHFDFYVDGSYLIEYDGEQHFIHQGNSTTSWNTEENYNKTKYRDKFKNEWCKNNNIPLIRIPYTKLSTLQLEDLLLPTTTFLCT